MKTNTPVATPATNRREINLRKTNKALAFLQNSISEIGEDKSEKVEAITVANDSGCMINVLGKDFNLSINLVIAKGGRS
jgi:hypothetical protein